MGDLRTGERSNVMSDGDGRDALASFVKNTNKAHNSEMRAMLEEKKRKLRT